MITNDKDVLSNSKTEAGETLEHIDFGDSSIEEIINTYQAEFKKMAEFGFFDSEIKAFLFENGVALTYGQILALAGDYFAVAEKPISVDLSNDKAEKIKKERSGERSQRFQEAYETLTKSEKAPRLVIAILTLLKDEAKRIQADLSTGKTVYESMSANVEQQTLISAKITQKKIPFWNIKGHLKKALSPMLNSHYMDLLKTNYDHFTPYAQVAYKTGHHLAIVTASQAQAYLSIGNEKEGYRYLMKAITLEAFACHYSTDAFSAGHMRVPRAELPDYAQSHPGYDDNNQSTVKRILSKLLKGAISTTAGLDSLGHILVHEQHDEDGQKGLWVSNDKQKECWQAFGDASFFEEKSTANRSMLINMVKAGLEDVFRVFKKENLLLDFKQYWPKVEDPGLGRNHYAMFRINPTNNKILEKRNNLANPDDKTGYIEADKWNAKEALAERGMNPLDEAYKFIMKH